MTNKRLLSFALLVLLVTAAIILPHWLCPAIFGIALLKGPILLGVIAGFPTPAASSTSQRFQETPCKVVIGNNYDTHGTVTRATIQHLTPTDLENLFRPAGLFADMDAWFRTSFEMQACGIKLNGMYDWVMSSQKNVGSLLNTEKVDRGPGLLYPFIKARQDSVINKDFWVIVNGIAKSGYTGNTPATVVGTVTAGPLTIADLALAAATDRVLRVITRYGFDLDPKWFNPTDRLNIFGRGANGRSERGQWRVLAAETSTDLSYVDVLVKDENVGSSTPFDPAPTTGILMRAGNNVSDYESFCANRPTLDPRKRVPYWYQTMRRIRRVDSEYKKVYARLMESNEYFRQFGDLPLAERNRQDEQDFQRNWLISFFWGKPISGNQTLANWQNLEQILTVQGNKIDPGTGGKVVAYRANMVGVYEQLRACGQVRDLQNNLLNFYEWLDANYLIYRARKSQGKPTDSIDWFTDATYAADLETGFIAYYKVEYGDILRIPIDVTNNTGSNEFGFHWRSFNVKFPAGISINIVTHEFFDDIVNAFQNEAVDLSSTGRFLLALDIGKPGPRGGTIYPGMIASNRKQRTLGELEQLARLDPTFACTMESITEEITLVSETVTAIVECPADSLWIEGIARGVPVTSGRTQPSPYVNLY